MLKVFMLNGNRSFIVKSSGLKINKIENKVSMRMVQNCDIQLEDVFVPDDDRLPGANSFQDLVDVINGPTVFSHQYILTENYSLC